MWVIETQESAPGEDSGTTDTIYDVRTEVQDEFLQLTSGKRVPAMIDFGTFGGKESSRALLETRQSTCGTQVVRASWRGVD